MRVVTTTEELSAFCDEIKTQEFVTVDTEFMREKTYWPILCLIQVAAPNAEAIIDPLPEEIDLAPLLDLLALQDVVKVFHAARQDVEIFVRLMGRPPAPLFDTQVAAMACGFGDQIGYEPLMRALLGAKIDKGSRFTDWSRRPLSDKQLTYALSDVTHLRDAYPILARKLDRDDRRDWVAEEMSALIDPGLYRTEPEEAWRRLKLRNVRPSEIGAVMKLAEWREREAQGRDVPRGRIIKDEAIFEIARLKPQTADDLARARSLPNGTERSKFGVAILDAVKEGGAIPREELPKVDRNPNRTPPPPDVVDMLKVVLKRQCERHDVAPRLIASGADLEELALNPQADIPALKGWRREVFGEAAEKVMRGEIALRLVGGKLDLVEL
ncbi:MAG: ribonuclease D [Pseudomonadota bacterium]